MTFKQPPKFASWLLKRFGCSAANDALLGDLAERYREGKAPVWYWRQALTAIVVCTIQDIQSRKLLALRALLAGILVHISMEYFVAHYLPIVPYWVPLSWWGTGLESVINSAIALILGIAVGWTLVRMYQGRRAILLYYLLIMQVLGVLTVAVSGSSLLFYLMADISLTFGILIGGGWNSSPASAPGLPDGFDSSDE